MNKTKYIENLITNMIQLRRLISEQTQENHEDHTATMLQFAALHFIIDHPQTTVGDLAKCMHLSKSSMTQLIVRLVETKLVQRVNDLEDRRIVHLEITDNGKNELTLIKHKIVMKIHKVLIKVPESDLKELIRIQNNLVESMKKEHHE
jgi:DNA-binding MarR family transcriptional regulator